MMKKISFSKLSLHQTFSRFLSISAFSFVSLLSGLTPDLLANKSNLVFSATAQAQSPPVSNEEVTSYAKVVLGIEKERQKTYTEIKNIIGGQPPEIACNKPESFNSLPQNARNIAANFCKHYERVVTDNGLSSERFNVITIQAQNDEDLKTRIRNELIKLQKEAGSQ
jgi:Domain of unknown function (DUF4168)